MITKGIVFAPIHTPHLTERYGRRPVYLVCVPIFALFILGASFSHSFAALLICRFFAGLFGGPTLVLIEGTFADVWSADVTVSYYSVLTLASFIGTACGPLIGGFIVALNGGWRWTQWMTDILTVGAYLFAIGMPETYPREIQRRRAKRTGKPLQLAPAQSGVTLRDMAFVTLVQPLVMIVSEPIVIALSLYVGFVFATIFQFFIAVPAVLNLTYNFTVADSGVAFTAAIAGVIIAAVTSTLLDRVTRPHVSARTHDGKVPEEYRMLPGMIGGIGITISFFWIAWTAKPTTSFLSPIFGTGLYIWGAASVLTSAISYLFDAYPPRATLSALTAAACFRLFLAGLIPLFIIQSKNSYLAHMKRMIFADTCLLPLVIMGLTGAWAYSTFGFIAAALMFIPWIIFFLGSKLRSISPYDPGYMPSSRIAPMVRDEEMHDMRGGAS